MDENYFDVIILGTGLTESILAAALSKAGFKVAHVDTNRYYGGDEASLSLDELVQWVDEAMAADSPYARFTRATHNMQDCISQSRYYAISLCPSIIPATGPIISSLVSSGVSKYGGFRLVDALAIYDAASRTLKSVPGSKEDVFKNKGISLVDKRRIMRFLAFAMGDFEDKQELEGKQELPFLHFLKSVFTLDDDVSSAIAYALAFCTSPTEPTLPALLRLRRYLRSAGRYGPSPFLVGHYGGSGEIAQGFCRAAAVSGATYILGRRLLSIVPLTSASNQDEFSYTVNLEDVPDSLFCKLLISSPSMAHHLPPKLSPTLCTSRSFAIARAIAVIDFSIMFTPSGHAEEADSELRTAEEGNKAIDTGIIVYPPSSLPGGSSSAAGTVFITGEGSMSAPRGKSIIHISVPVESENGVSPETLLSPYLNATLSLVTDGSTRVPLFTTFYLERTHVIPTPDAAHMFLITPPLLNERLPEASDTAAAHAEDVFWHAVRLLRTGSDETTIESFWPSASQENEADEDW